MRRYLIIAGAVCLLSATGFAAERSMLARVTVYWASGGSGSDHWTRKHIAASGARLRNGHCAVDPRRIPYGSRVTLPDGTLIAVDTGGAVRSRRAARLAGRSASERNAIVIDRFFETKAQALAWAKRNPQFISVRVSSPNERLTSSETVAQTRALPIVNSPAANSGKPAVVSIAQSQSTTTSTNVTSAPRVALRHSISTARMDASASARGATPPQLLPKSLSSAPKLAANNATPPRAEQTRSHYGRAVADLP